MTKNYLYVKMNYIADIPRNNEFNVIPFLNVRNLYEHLRDVWGTIPHPIIKGGKLIGLDASSAKYCVAAMFADGTKDPEGYWNYHQYIPALMRKEVVQGL